MAATLTAPHGRTASASTGPVVRVSLLPETFRFVDTNPMVGEPYSTSFARDLPPWAMREVPVTPEAWDSLVHAGATARVVDPFRLCSLADIAVGLRLAALGAPPPEVCVECWGTVVAVDTDGSLSGRVGALYLCSCAEQPWMAAAR